MTDIDPNRTQPDYRDVTLATINLTDASPEMVSAVAELLEACQRQQPSADIIGSTNYSGFVIWERKAAEDIEREITEAALRSEKWDIERKEREAAKELADIQAAEALGVTVDEFRAARDGE